MFICDASVEQHSTISTPGQVTGTVYIQTVGSVLEGDQMKKSRGCRCGSRGGGRVRSNNSVFIYLCMKCF